MKNHRTFPLKLTLTLAFLVTLRGIAWSQLSDTNPIPSQSTFLNTLVNTTYARSASDTQDLSYVLPEFDSLAHSFESNQPNTIPNEYKTNVPPLVGQKFLNRFTLGYSFTRINSKTGNEALTNAHSIIPEYVLANSSGFALDAAASYENDTSHNNKPSHSVADAYGLSIQAGQDLLEFWRKSLKDTKIAGDSLTLSLLLGGTRSHGGTTFADSHSGTTSDTFKASPGITYVHKFSGDSAYALSFSSLYSQSWKDTANEDTPDTDTNGGVFSLGTKLNYQHKGSPWGFSVGGTWFHDTNQKVAPDTIASYHDWAQFSCGLEYDAKLWGADTSFNLVYAYTAFRPDYDSHTIKLQGSVKF